MTSIERAGFATYMGATKPAYNILTYTWGRWEIRDKINAVVLPVKGIPWAIPPIKEEHFTIAAFQEAVDTLGDDGCQWAWVDVACIHQEDEILKADEVGRQASIFKNASGVYVWLSHLSIDKYQDMTKSLKDDCSILGNYGNQWFEVPRQPFKVVEEAVERLYYACNYIFSDPWFTSLWTLQEYTLRNDIKILSATGGAINDTITNLRGQLGGLHQNLEPFLLSFHTEKPKRSPKARALVDMASNIRIWLERAGFQHYPTHSNPNVQYGTARLRTSSRAVDRIYAIMQVYNLRVGKSARPQDNPDLNELIDEFAVAINKKCPMLGQMFNHSEPPDEGKSWRITQASFVPDSLIGYVDPKPECRIFQRDGDTIAIGEQTPLNDMIDILRNNPHAGSFHLSIDAGTFVADAEGGPSHQKPLNLHKGFSDAVAGYLRNVRLRHFNFSNWETPHLLDARFGISNLLVLRLGTLEGGKDDVRQGIGLVLRRTSSELQGDKQNVVLCRIGTCGWVSEALVRAVERLPWQQGEFILY